MDGVGRERRDANRHVFGAFGRAVTNPFAFARDDGLAGFYFGDAAFVLHAHHAFEDHGVFIEVGALTGFDQPTGLRMWAMLVCVSPEFTRPMYSSMILFPGTGICVGASISLGTYSYRSDSTGAMRVALRAG